MAFITFRPPLHVIIFAVFVIKRKQQKLRQRTRLLLCQVFATAFIGFLGWLENIFDAIVKAFRSAKCFIVDFPFFFVAFFNSFINEGSELGNEKSILSSSKANIEKLNLILWKQNKTQKGRIGMLSSLWSKRKESKQRTDHIRLHKRFFWWYCVFSQINTTKQFAFFSVQTW